MNISPKSKKKEERVTKFKFIVQKQINLLSIIKTSIYDLEALFFSFVKLKIRNILKISLDTG